MARPRTPNVAIGSDEEGARRPKGQRANFSEVIPPSPLLGDGKPNRGPSKLELAVIII